jgi:hypothetical protein
MDDFIHKHCNTSSKANLCQYPTCWGPAGLAVNYSCAQSVSLSWSLLRMWCIFLIGKSKFTDGTFAVTVRMFQMLWKISSWTCKQQLLWIWQLWNFKMFSELLLFFKWPPEALGLAQ